MTNRQKAAALVDKINIIKAFAEGAQIQIYETVGFGAGKWHDVKDDITPNVFVTRRIRVKPEPKYIPFTENDHKLFAEKWVVKKTGEKRHAYKLGNRDNLGDAGVSIGDSRTGTFYPDLLTYYEFIDGKPCGKLVDSE